MFFASYAYQFPHTHVLRNIPLHRNLLHGNSYLSVYWTLIFIYMYNHACFPLGKGQLTSSRYILNKPLSPFASVFSLYIGSIFNHSCTQLAYYRVFNWQSRPISDLSNQKNHENLICRFFFDYTNQQKAKRSNRSEPGGLLLFSVLRLDCATG